MEPTWQRGDVSLYLGDCREILPHLPKVDAVDAVVTDGIIGGHEQATGGKCKSSQGIIGAMGCEEGRDSSHVRDEIPAGDSGPLLGISQRDTEGHAAIGHPVEISREVGECERQVQARHGQRDIQKNGREKVVRGLPSDAESLCPSHQRRSHGQSPVKPRGPVHVVSQQKTQTCVVGRSTWALVSDPPYGISLGARPSRVSDGGYENSDDSADWFVSEIAPRITEYISQSNRAAVFMAGRSICRLPPPTAMGGVYCPAGSGTTAWGFTCFHPVLFYGAAPWAHAGLRPNVLRSTAITERNGHPCPKPIEWMNWLVRMATIESETILDPFMGSGTTGVAAVKLGRKFIGCEIEEKYFKIAVRRISEAQDAFSLLEGTLPPAVTQADLFPLPSAKD